MSLVFFVGSLLAALALGTPVVFALIASALALMYHLDMFMPQILAQNMVVGANNFPLLAIPFFLLAGEIMNASGMSRRIVDFAISWVGHIRGGLGIVAIIAALIMASLSGSAAADTAALAAILVPMMRNAGHDPGRSVGLMAAGGIIAPVIPPSLAFIIFGVATNVSISQLFLAGIFPGLMMGFALLVTWLWVSRRDGVAPLPKASARERWQATAKAGWALGMPVIILGGIRFGIVTPTEAAVVAAVYSLFVGTVVYRSVNLRSLHRLLLNAAIMSAVVMALAAAALTTGWLITMADVPGDIFALVEPLVDNPKLLLVTLMLIIMLIGMVLDLGPTILILAPVLMPVVKSAGIDPVYFGVLFVMNTAISLITPPVGIVLNVASGVTKTPLATVIRGVSPFILAQFVVLFLLVAFPQLVMVPLSWMR